MSRTIHLLIFVLLSVHVGQTAGAQYPQLQNDNELTEMLDGKIITADGDPAKNAIVYGIIRQIKPGLLLNTMSPNIDNNKNRSIKLQTHPVDNEEQPFIGPVSPFATLGKVWSFKTNENGDFNYPAKLTSFFIQSQDGTEVAFVPPGSEFPIQLRKCAKLKINNSVLSKKSGVSGKGNIIITWKNCLAGSYP